MRPAAALYCKHLEDLGKLPAPLKRHLGARYARAEQSGRLDLYSVRLLVLSVGNDGDATTYLRFLAKYMARGPWPLCKRLARLVAEGSLRRARKGCGHVKAAYAITESDAWTQTRQGEHTGDRKRAGAKATRASQVPHTHLVSSGRQSDWVLRMWMVLRLHQLLKKRDALPVGRTSAQRYSRLG